MVAEEEGQLAEPAEVVDETVDDEESDILPLYTIVSYGADYDVRGLVSRMEEDDIEVPAFQRGFVWTRRQASRFIESLLMGLPVPGIFLWRDPESQKLYIIDGQQRLRTLQAYYRGVLLGREFKLPEPTSPYQTVHPRFQNQSYRTLEDDDRRRLDNSIIHATIINQERPPTDDSSIYYIFERLNTEGTPLQPQEIRSTVYRGPLIELLARLNASPAWRTVYGEAPSPRLKDSELILRFFALYFANLDFPAAEDAGADSQEYGYARPMKEFLNKYCQANRYLSMQGEDELTALFESTLGIVANALGREAFRPGRALNAAVFDAVTVGLGRRISQDGNSPPVDALKEAYAGLLANEEFITNYSRATADHESVRKRVELATAAFSTV